MAHIIRYAPEHFGLLRRAAERNEQAASLRHRPFVDHYYASSEWCALHLLLADDGSVAGTLGVDRMPFRVDDQEMAVGFGSSFYAFQPGAGGYLFMQWLKSCPIGLVFGGSPDTHRILRQQRWSYYEGVKVYHLNRCYEPRPGEPAWRRLARRLVLASRRTPLAKLESRLPPEVARRLSVREEHAYSDGLLPSRSPFAFRFAPSVDYLNWRYNLELSFIRYRLFRILARDATAGYVVINERPSQLLVAHCDGEDPETLAWGVVLSLLEVAREDEGPRAAAVASSHPAMQRVYERFGLRADSSGRAFALGSLRGPVDVPSDTAAWLVNLGWGDNDLRAPFLDQSTEASR